MKRNDKLVAILGVAILVLAAIGIYYVEEETVSETADVEDFFAVMGSIKEMPEAMVVSDSCPFYPLIVTPIAVNYDSIGYQNVVPLYVMDFDDTSSAVERAEEMIGIKVTEEITDEDDAKNISLEFAEKYWTSSDAAILVEYSEEGYSQAIVAVPIASYLGIPVIVTDMVDSDVMQVLDDLGVERTIVCGDLDDYGKTLRFEDSDEITDAVIEVVEERFNHEVGYVTLANPRDAFPPKVLSEEVLLSESGTLSGANALPSNILKVGGVSKTYTFTMPDYKYTLIKLDVKDLIDQRHVEEFGDGIVVGGTLTGYGRTQASPVMKNEEGEFEYDQFHFESVFYDAGGIEQEVTVTAGFTVVESGDYEITVTAYELDNPYYPTMQQFSSLAPYLTAYHKGIVFARSDFAFAADDDVKYDEETLPGNTQVFFNPMLIPIINQHVYENIHKPMNELMSKIKHIDISESTQYLQEECFRNPVYVALVGDSVMLPQYYYRSSHNDPFRKAPRGNYGTNCPSDFIYGNIDPEPYSLLPYPIDHLENDLWTEYPAAENIVGRITGWDVQDGSALIARTVFYDNVISGLGEWKDNAAILVGAGTEMQKLPIFTAIRELIDETEPIKFPSGEKKFLVQRIIGNFEEGGFNAQSAERATAQRVGYTNAALDEIKKDGLLNRILFPTWLAKLAQNFQHVTDLFKPKWYLESLFGESSDNVIGGKLEMNSNLIISDSHAIFFEKEHGDVAMDTIGGPFFIYQLFGRFIPILPLRTPLSRLGSYSVRDVCEMDMGPSVMLVEGCGSGKIDGVDPRNTLANAYLHAGVNGYISPTTFSAFYGALEPRFGNKGVGFGIAGYLKAALNARKGIYPDVYFNQYMFEQIVLEMAHDDIPLGVALRNAKNDYLKAQIDISFRWTPPLSISSSLPQDIREDIEDSMYSMSAGGDNTFPVEKYCTIYQINLLGDPAFNPYEPVNEG